MTKDDIIRMADKQGLVDYFDLDGDSVGQLMLCTLVLDCIAAEREACAKLCEQEAKELNLEAEYAEDGSYNWKADGALDCAAAIRARGQE
jgi:hypothetical protein